MRLKGAFFVFLFIFASLSFASAIDLEIEKKVITDLVVAELDTPASFWFTIKNIGQSDSFEIYSLVDVDIAPKSAFRIESGQFKKIKVEVKAGKSVKDNPGYFNFVYKIKGSNTGTLEDTLRIKVIRLQEAIEIETESINPGSEKAGIKVKNKENFDFGEIEAEFSSVFFDAKEQFSLGALEEKSFQIDIKEEELKTLMAGPYILNSKIKIGDVEEAFGATINFLEKEDISTKEAKSGWIITKEEIEKINDGNTPAVAEITIKRNIISHLFNTFNIQPLKVEREGTTILYRWQQELRPGESLSIIAKTNWIIPIVIVIALIAIVIIVRIYFVSDIVLKKKIGLVKTKGGEFALKVSMNVKAKRRVEKIHIIDKLPALVKIYKRYGAITPDRIDEKKRRIEWNIDVLEEGEGKIISYVIYSKIGIVGKFGLPEAKAIYERNGRVKETKSNKVFFVSEPRNAKKEED